MYNQVYYENIVKCHLPAGAEIIVSKSQCCENLVYAVDLDQDGALEIITAYRLEGEVYLIVLKNYGHHWHIISKICGKGYNITYLKVAPITCKDTYNIVVGWQVGAIWSELAIYEWQQNGLEDIITEPIYFSNIEVNNFHSLHDRSGTYKIALWIHDTGDAYEVQVLRWCNNTLVQAKDVYPYYFKRVVKYYKILIKEIPDSPVYWYYLADAQYKARMLDEALQSINRALTFSNPYPSRQVLLALQDKIMSCNTDDLQSIDQIQRINNAMTEEYLFPVMVRTIHGQKWGYIDSKGRYAIEPQYSYAMDFQDNGYAIVEFAGKNGIINTRGEYIVKPRYNMITEFSEGRAAVVDNKGYWIINEQGEIISSKAYNYVGMYSEGRAIFADTDANGDYLYGYLDLAAKEVIPKQYLSGSSFQNGKAVVQIDEKKSALIDLNGQVLHTYNYPYVGSFGDGLLTFQETLGGKYGYINEQGQVVIAPKYTWAQVFENGRAIVNIADNYINQTGIINVKGEYIVPPEYNSILSLGDKRYAIGKAIDSKQPFLGSKYAIADIDGKILTDFKFNHVSEYNHGVASVDDGKQTYFVDHAGAHVRSLPTIEGTGTLSIEGKGNVIRANQDIRVFYLDRAGNIIWQPNTVIPLTHPYKVIEKKYKPNKDYLVYYPEIAGMSDPRIQQQVNQRLREMSLVKPVEPDEQLDYSYTGDFLIAFYQGQLLVLELTGYNFPFGAAHGMPTKVYAHVDLVTGQFYQLPDLFKPNSDYVKVLSNIIAEQIKTNPEYSYVFPDSYKGIQPNQPFYVTADALHIYFEPYEIAPYAAGFPTFRIPFTEIESIINREGKFWRSFH